MGKRMHHTAAAFPSAFHAQAGLLPGQQRWNVFLRRMRTLRREMPAVAEYRKSHQTHGRYQVNVQL